MTVMSFSVFPLCRGFLLSDTLFCFHRGFLLSGLLFLEPFDFAFVVFDLRLKTRIFLGSFTNGVVIQKLLSFLFVVCMEGFARCDVDGFADFGYFAVLIDFRCGLNVNRGLSPVYEELAFGIENQD